jgi:hypothetical protein
MLKFLLVAVLIGLLFGSGGQRVRSLLNAGRRAKKDFNDAKGRGEDPVGHAREVGGRVVDDTDKRRLM